MKYGSAHGRWLGDRAGYFAFHHRVSAQRGDPKHCEQCGLSDPARVYHWANLTGRYSDTSDYERMCVPCHRKYDYGKKLKADPTSLQRPLCAKGHEMTAANVYLCKGIRRCKTCTRGRVNQWRRDRRKALKAERLNGKAE